MFPGPIIELHISNIHRREPIYHHSLVSTAATAVIAGLGANGYVAAVQAVGEMLSKADQEDPLRRVRRLRRRVRTRIPAHPGCAPLERNHSGVGAPVPLSLRPADLMGRNLDTLASELEQEVELLRRELGETRAQQAATAEILKVISGSAFDLDAVLTKLIRSGIELCDAARGVIWLKRDGKLYLAAHAAYPAEWVAFAEANPLTPAADAQTTSGIAAFTGDIVHVEDILNNPRFNTLSAHPFGNYRAGLAVPLKRDGHVLGVISLSRPEACLFTDRQVALVQTFADQAMIAIENARLFEEVQARNGELAKVLDQQTATSQISWCHRLVTRRCPTCPRCHRRKCRASLRGFRCRRQAEGGKRSDLRRPLRADPRRPEGMGHLAKMDGRALGRGLRNYSCPRPCRGCRRVS